MTNWKLTILKYPGNSTAEYFMLPGCLSLLMISRSLISLKAIKKIKWNLILKITQQHLQRSC